MVGVGSHADVGQPITELDWNAVSFGGFNVGRSAGDLGGFVMNLPSKVLELSAGDDGFAAGHSSDLVENANDGATVCVDCGTTLGERQVLHSVGVEPSEVNRTTSVASVACVVAGDGTAGTAVEELQVAFSEGPSIDTDDVGGTGAAAMVSKG